MSCLRQPCQIPSSPPELKCHCISADAGLALQWTWTAAGERRLHFSAWSPCHEVRQVGGWSCPTRPGPTQLRAPQPGHSPCEERFPCPAHHYFLPVASRAATTETIKCRQCGRRRTWWQRSGEKKERKHPSEKWSCPGQSALKSCRCRVYVHACHPLVLCYPCSPWCTAIYLRHTGRCSLGVCLPLPPVVL